MFDIALIGSALAKKEEKLIARNKRALHEYEVVSTMEAGIVLTGTEVCSLRENNCQLTDCFALVRKGEVWLMNLHIAPYSHGNIANPDPDRNRKLLLHKKEIRKLLGMTTIKGLTLVPLRMYINEDGRAKVELAVARGKKNYDKREDIAKRDADRRMQQAMRRDRY